ncbi:MAG: hypothetical protein JWN30_2252, partial [Bacilli bacterium]|nr:hypothetical protein [Bacilli bacterium]
MTIYQVTYLSDNYQVKGFLGLPMPYTIEQSSWNRFFHRAERTDKLPSLAPLNDDQQGVADNGQS